MFKIMKRLSAKLRIKCVMLALLAIAGAYLVSLIPTCLGGVLDSISRGAGSPLNLVVSFTVLFFISEALNIYRRVAVDRVSAKYEEELRNNSIGKLLRLPMRKLSSNGVSGELTSKINQAVSGASQLMKLLINDLLPAVSVGSFVVLQCFGQAPAIVALIMLGYIACTLTVSLLQIKSQRGIRETIIRKKTKLDGDICQSITGIEQIRSLGAEDAECARLSPQTKGIRVTECRHHTIMGVFDIAKHIVKVLFFAGILIMGITLTRKGEMTAGNVLATVLLFQQLLKPIDEFYRFLDEVSACSIKADILLDIMDSPSDTAFQILDGDGINDAAIAAAAFGDGDSIATIAANEINIKDYEVLSPAEDRILSKSTGIVFPTGCATALVAQTGGGKSSLMKGMLRLYPLYGTISVFGVNWNKISQKKLTELIHYIPQSPFFFAGSLRDNLAYGLEKTPDDYELISALKKACIYEEFSKPTLELSSPLDYFVEENARNFSGGQLKRLAIARAFLRKPKIYILDETLANIDGRTIEMILANLETHAKSIGAGTVHISHDRKIIDSCVNAVTLKPAV